MTQPGIIVDPGGFAKVSVTFTCVTNGGTPTVYSDRETVSSVSLPDTPTAVKPYYMAPGTYKVSVKSGGLEYCGQTLTIEGTQTGYAAATHPPTLPGSLLGYTSYAPSSVSTYTLVAIGTGLTALDTTNLLVTFTAPPNGNVLVRLSAFAQGGATAADNVLFGVVSSTGSPGTLVGVGGLVFSSPVATAVDDEAAVSTEQIITGLTAGTAYTWYFAGAYVTAAGKVLAQGGSTVTTSATGCPATMSVWAA